LYRFLRFASWKRKERRKFILHGTLKGRKICDNPEIVNCHDIALFLDESNVAVRSGLICAHPLVQAVSAEGIIQASIHAYNSLTDIDHLMDTLVIISNQLL